MSTATTETDVYRVETRPGTTVAETIRCLASLPPDAVFDEHFGDVDLLMVFRDKPQREDVSHA